MSLSEQEQKRYTRQMMMEGWGEATQKKIKQSTVFIAGAGGLGSPVSIYLAVAGVGNIRICDFDSPDWSNLNRQILHDHTRIGTNKAVSAKMTLERLNGDITVTAITDKIVAENVVPVIATERLLTAVTVPNRSTIVLGGLITENEEKTTSGIPVISRILVLGNAFKSTKKTKSRKELIIFIQPVVVEDGDDVRGASHREDLRTEVGASAAEVFPEVPLPSYEMPLEQPRRIQPLFKPVPDGKSAAKSKRR